jgi:hypothetical protein
MAHLVSSTGHLLKNYIQYQERVMHGLSWLSIGIKDEFLWRQ